MAASHPDMSSCSSSSPPPSPFKDNCLEGRSAVVTGGGSGIGYEISRQLLQHGCRAVLVVGRRQQFLDEAVRTLRQEISLRQQQQQSRQKQCVHGFACDVRKPEQCRAALEHFARILKMEEEEVVSSSSLDSSLDSSSSFSVDILVNGAAGNFLAPAEELSPKGFETVMAIDAMGTFNMTTSAFPLLKNSSCPGGAVVVNISATLQYGATWFQIHASAAKSAVDSMTRSWALEWGGSPYGIRVNGIAPGPIADTPGTTKLAPTSSGAGSRVGGGILKKNGNHGRDGELGKGAANHEVDGWVKSSVPLQRMGTAEEIGHAVLYLCTARYVTGATLVVDGGEWLYKPPLISRRQVADLSRKVEAASRAQRPKGARHGAGPAPTPAMQSML